MTDRLTPSVTDRLLIVYDILPQHLYATSSHNIFCYSLPLSHLIRHCCVACRGDQHRCLSTGHCIAAETICDGNNNCGDWSDENCTGEWHLYTDICKYLSNTPIPLSCRFPDWKVRSFLKITSRFLEQTVMFSEKQWFCMEWFCMFISLTR